jgi:hypothetical protein
MITRKITAVIALLHYVLNFVRAIIYLPYEVKAFGKNSDLRYDIFKPIYDNHALDVLDSIINTIVWPLSSLAMVVFLLTFLFEKSVKNQILNDVNTATNNENSPNLNDQPSAGLNIVSFLIPLVGLIIYLTERERAPRKAASAGKAALWGVGVTVLLTLISFLVTLSLLSSVG